MKTRKGFVSNSSSSSFIIALKGSPETYEDIKSMVKLTGDHLPDGCSEDFAYGYLSGQIHSYSGVSTGDLVDLMREFFWSCELPEMEEHGKWDSKCEKKYKDSDGKCKSKCPCYNECTDRFEYGTFEHSEISAKFELKELDIAYEFTKKFINKTLGYKYYYIVFPCQSKIGTYFGDHHKKIFKNINYVVLSEH